MAFVSSRRISLLALTSLTALLGCNVPHNSNTDMSTTQITSADAVTMKQQASTPSPLVYQLLPRVFGNQNLTNTPWGSIEENGSGKFADIDEVVLADLKHLGVSHVWYTGVLHHASVTDYSTYGIPRDDADVVKGLAGSPYAIRD